MKKLFFCLLIVILAYASTPLDGSHNLALEAYDSAESGRLLWSSVLGNVIFNDGEPNVDIMSIVRSYDFDEEIVYVQLIVDGERLDGSRIAIDLASSLHREAEPMDEMAMGIQIGEPGNDVAVRGDGLVVGAGDPNEKVTVEGAVSLEGTDTPPTSSTGFGKIFVSSDDGELYFIREDGSGEALSIDETGSSTGILSIEAEDRDSAMVGLLRLEAEDGMEITESMEGDTAIIVVRFTGDCGSGCTAAPSSPTLISGATTICSGEPGASYAVPPVECASFYRWTLPSGSVVIDGMGSNSIRAVFGDTDGNVCVTALNDIGESSPVCLGVTINRPTSPGPITGDALVCSGAMGKSYFISTVPDATNYIWTLPAGAVLASGTGSPSVTVNFATLGGDICVQTENSCGTSAPVCLPITITDTPATPGSITGSGAVCSGETGVSYEIAPVAEATSYNWTLPTGATIASGAGTVAIDVDFTTSGGDVCVQATSICGSSSSRCFSVAMMSSPVIASGPSNASVDEGDPATFSVSASGDGLVYQWQQSIDSGSSWANIGSGGSSYSISSTTAGMDGNYYRCIVSGSCAPSDTSASAILTVSTTLYTFTSHTFTNCGATGRTGPTLSACRSSYSTTWDETYLNMSTQGIQEWTVPEDGTYRIEANGAKAGDHPWTYAGGNGARMRGDFVLSRGDIIKIIVGQRGTDCTSGNSANGASGGGGGSFVWLSSDDTYPLIAAGGGGGSCLNNSGASAATGKPGVTTESGSAATSGSNQGTGGGDSSCLNGGKGWNTMKTGTVVADGSGYNSGGGFGGASSGGYNCGGNYGHTAGGGGGYSGGGGGTTSYYYAGGGGGSYNSGANQANSGGANSGHGYVYIEKL